MVSAAQKSAELSHGGRIYSKCVLIRIGRELDSCKLATLESR